MKRLALICFGATVCVILPGLCHARLAFFAGLDGRRTFGHTTFEISVRDDTPETTQELYYKSNIEFPLDTYMAGFSAGLGGSVWRGKPWSVIFGMRKSLNDPSGPVKDRDWFELPAYSIHKTMSFTESEVELDALVMDVNASCTFLVHPDFTVDGMLGYRYQDFSYEVFGVRGWQLDEFWHRVEFDTLNGINVLDYEVTYGIPYLGVTAEIGDPTGFSLRGEFAFSPWASAEDYDDHIFRNKTARTKADGSAVIAGINTVWVLPWGKKTQWQVDVGGEIVTLSTRGDQVQTWYGDDPITPEEDDTGSSISGIDDKLTSSFYSVNAVLGCRF